MEVRDVYVRPPACGCGYIKRAASSMKCHATIALSNTWTPMVMPEACATGQSGRGPGS